LLIAESAIETRHHALLAAVRLRSDRVVRRVVAAGYSGSLPPTERPDFEEILDAAEQHEFDYVQATEIARVNRGEAYSYYCLKHELARYGVGLEFLDQQFTDDGETARVR
jgi:DNA invertase Pin-like site-specific DNA recombinase